LYTWLIFPMHTMCLAHLLFLDFVSPLMFCDHYKLWSLLFSVM
jgi:hypothetical protein